jgi:hypothetical protein
MLGSVHRGTNFPYDLREMAWLPPVNKVEAAYRRGDLFEKRRQLAPM